MTDCFLYDWGSFGNDQCDEGWRFCVNQHGTNDEKGWYSKSEEIPMNEQEWKKATSKNGKMKIFYT